MKGVSELHAGDLARTLTGGGGGYGDPLKRDPQRVADDVREGYVGREHARLDYGVVIDDTGKPMPAETKALRAQRAAASAKFG